MNGPSSGDEGEPTVEDDQRAFGLTPEQIAHLKAQREASRPPAFEVLPANWLAVRIFLDCAGQWNKDGAGTSCAINRTWLQSNLQLWAVSADKTEDTFARIRVMEQKAAGIFRKRAKQAQDRARRSASR